MEEGKKSGSDRCAVCGAHAERGRMCECCRESLALCDMENWLERKEEKKNCAPCRANAFK